MTIKEARIGMRISKETDEWIIKKAEAEIRSEGNFMDYCVCKALALIETDPEMEAQILAINIKKGRPVSKIFRVDKKTEEKIQNVPCVKEGKVKISNFLCRLFLWYQKNEPQ